MAHLNKTETVCRARLMRRPYRENVEMLRRCETISLMGISAPGLFAGNEYCNILGCS